MSNQMLRLEMKMPLFLQAAPGMSLGEEFDAPCKRLELSSAVKVKTHQFFLQISLCPWLKCSSEGGRGVYRIRPLGVTVLSRMRPAPSHKRALTHSNKMVSRRGIYCSRTPDLAFSRSWRHREGPVLHWLAFSRDGWLMAGATTLELFTKSNFSEARQSVA